MAVTMKASLKRVLRRPYALFSMFFFDPLELVHKWRGLAAYARNARTYRRLNRSRAFDIRWADLWYRQTSSMFLQSYLKTTTGAIFIPQSSDDLHVMLEAYLLDKAVYEIGYELNNRPNWVLIPIRGIKHILQTA